MTADDVNNEKLELEDIESENKDDDSTPAEYEITIIPADYTLEVLYSQWKHDDIIIPKFQRAFVWNIKQSSRLIESFMMGLPIPPVFFFVQKDQKHLVIDGMQRLQSVFYFFEGYFGESDVSDKRRQFRLEGINENSRWYEKRFVDFDESDQRKFKNTVLRSVLVKQVHPEKDQTSIYHIFERLNTGGTSLQDQEVRNCIYSGKLNDLLIELNRYESWRKILGKSKPDTRQKDVKLILRYMSLMHDSSKYQKPMKEFLSKFMNTNRNPSDDFLEMERICFIKTCDLIVKKLGSRPFNPKGALNPSVFDSIFIAFAKNIDNCPENIKEKVDQLKTNPDFKKYTSDATTDTEIVTNRLKLVEKQLFQ